LSSNNKKQRINNNNNNYNSPMIERLTDVSRVREFIARSGQIWRRVAKVRQQVNIYTSGFIIFGSGAMYRTAAKKHIL